MYIIARRLRYNVKETVTVEPNTLALRGPLQTSEVGQNTGVHPASSAMAATTDTQAQKYVLASPSRRATTSHDTSCAVDSLELAAGESEDDGVTSQARANPTDRSFLLRTANSRPAPNTHTDNPISESTSASVCRFRRPFPWASLLHRGTHQPVLHGSITNKVEARDSSQDINTAVEFEEFMGKEDIASKILDNIRKLSKLDTEANQKRLVKKRTRDELAYLHNGLTHMIDIFREFVDPGRPRKQV